VNGSESKGEKTGKLGEDRYGLRVVKMLKLQKVEMSREGAVILTCLFP
jgi:hypothetical protein